MAEQRKFHSILSSTAIRLSVYSSFLDFGLTISVFLLQRHLLPLSTSSFLLSIFDDAIAYLTFAIITLFSAAIILRLKERIITIKTPSIQTPKKMQKITVSLSHENTILSNSNKGIIKAAVPNQSYTVERVINHKNQDFIHFNGVWYKVAKDRFDKVPRPDY